MTPSASALRRMSPRASAASSTNWQKRAPRDSASSPSAPVPAKRSSTLVPSTVKPSMPWTRILKIASRTRSEVGRVSRPAGAARLRPPSVPPTIRILAPAPDLHACLVLDHPSRYLLDLARLEIPELEWPEGGADEPVDREPQMFAHPLDLAVLTLADGEAQPGVVALFLIDPGFDRAVVDALDGDARPEAGERLGIGLAEGAHPVAPHPAGRRTLDPPDKP